MRLICAYEADLHVSPAANINKKGSSPRRDVHNSQKEPEQNKGDQARCGKPSPFPQDKSRGVDGLLQPRLLNTAKGVPSMVRR